MRITTQKKVVVEDFEASSRPLVTRLAQILNSFLDQVAQALTSNITLADNLKAKVFKAELASGVSTLSFSWDLNEKPTAVYIGSLTRTDGAVPPVHSLYWTYADKQVSCTITGLDSVIHNITLVAQV